MGLLSPFNCPFLLHRPPRVSRRPQGGGTAHFGNHWFKRYILIADPNKMDLEVDGEWCSAPLINRRPRDVGFTTFLVTRLKMLSDIEWWLTSRNVNRASTSPSGELLESRRKSNPLFLNYMSTADLTLIFADSEVCNPNVGINKSS